MITAHRGLPSAALFTDLDKMKKGDHFLLHVLDDTLCYQIDKITVIEPEDTKAMAVEDGMDLVTLVTCTPYGVNSHRLLVRGHRAPYDPQALEDEGVPLNNMSLHTNYLMWIVVGLLITGIFSFFLYRREKNLRRAVEKDEVVGETAAMKTEYTAGKKTDARLENTARTATGESGKKQEE